MLIQMCLLLFLFVVSVADSSMGSTADDPERHVEMGKVDWDRYFEAARKIAKRNRKPLFVLFQEIRGAKHAKILADSRYPILCWWKQSKNILFRF